MSNEREQEVNCTLLLQQLKLLINHTSWLTDLETRNLLICALARSSYLSLQDIGDCFGRTRQWVHQIVSSKGVEVVPKALQKSRVAERFNFLSEHPEIVSDLMTTVAKDISFWREGYKRRRMLNKAKILEELGFPKSAGESTKSRIWRELRERRLITEDLLAGVAIHYGLGEDTKTFLQEQYHNDPKATLETVVTLINKKCRESGALEVSYGTLKYYMDVEGIPRKRRDPEKYRRREERLDFLSQHPEVVSRVMAGVAADVSFWGGGKGRCGTLNRGKVLVSLGFSPLLGREDRTKIWKQLIIRGIVCETQLAGVLIRYGLGHDPRKLIIEQYHDDPEATFKDCVNAINELAREAGLLSVSVRAVWSYVRNKGIARKPQVWQRPYRGTLSIPEQNSKEKT